MKKALSLFLLAAGLLMAGAAIVAEETPTQIELQSVTVEAEVVAIDHETRAVTLKGKDGSTVTFKAGDKVKRLGDIKPGDTVVAEYYESLAMRILPPAESGAEGVLVQEAAAKAGKTEAPAGGVARQIETVVEILAIDMDAQAVTIKGPDGNSQTVKARYPENLKKIKVGDKVQIVYTEAFAIGIEPKPSTDQ